VKQYIRQLRDRGLYRRLRFLRERDWRRRHQKVFANHPSYQTPCDPCVEAEHRRLWSPLNRRVDISTLRICANISGQADPRIIPEDIFAVDVEPLLVERGWSHFLQHKSLYSRLFPAGGFPRVFLHGILGSLYSSDLVPITKAEARRQIDALDYPLLIKPNIDSMGGSGVYFCDSPEDLWRRITGFQNFVVQPVEAQSDYFQRFSQTGLNTCRVDIYRSVSTDEFHVLNVAMRMGRHGSLDNETAGGIVCCISPNGVPGAFAVDKYGTRFMSHPDSGVRFAEAGPIPQFAKLIELSKQIAASVVGTRLIALDMFFDKSECWRCMEVNLLGLTIRFAQYAGQPFLGEFTDEVVEYAQRHERKGLATWQVA
jgi:hypothetical protein